MPKKCSFDACMNPVWGGGFCKNHQFMRPKKEKSPSINHRGLFVREIEPIEDGKEELDKWFKERELDIINSGERCWECGGKIPKAYFRHATAHLFPKSIFGSVATNPRNFLILCASNGCHSQFDHSIEKASQMGIWKEAVERFLEILPHVKEHHKYLELFKEKIWNNGQ